MATNQNPNHNQNCALCETHVFTKLCKECAFGMCDECTEEHLNIPECKEHSVRKKPDEICMQCKSLYISVFCEQCIGYLCEKCKNKHLKIPVCKTHQLKQVRCPCIMCENSEVDFKCNDCNGNLCNKCVGEHNGIPNCKDHTMLKLFKEPDEATPKKITKDDNKDNLKSNKGQQHEQVIETTNQNQRTTYETPGDIGKKDVEEQHTREEVVDKRKELIKRLGLGSYFPNKMTMEDVVLINEFAVTDTPPTVENQLPFYILHKIMMLNYKARSVQISQEVQEETSRPSYQIDDENFLKSFLSGSSQICSVSFNQIHPLDIILAILYCADQFLQQYIVGKLADCQIALPFLIHNSKSLISEGGCDISYVFPLWTLRTIRKSWCSKVPDNQRNGDAKGVKDQLMSSAKTPLVSFVKIGESHISKSELMNGIISKNSHTIFFHRDCKGSCENRVLVDGVVEFCWYLPGGKNDDEFNNAVTFTNLRGNAVYHHKQLEFIGTISNIIVVLASQNDLKDDPGRGLVQKLLKGWHTTIFLVVDSEAPQTVQGSGYFLGVQKLNRAQLKERLHEILYVKIMELKERDHISPEEIRQIANRHAITCDEDVESCIVAQKKAADIMGTIEGAVDISLAKKCKLPLQGNKWHDICSKTKELYRPRTIGDELIEERKSKIRAEIEILLEKQRMNYSLTDTISEFINMMSSGSSELQSFSLKWLKLKLDQLSSDKLPVLTREYNKHWIGLCELKKKKPVDSQDENAHSQLIEEENKSLQMLNKKLIDSSFGVEHLMRELAQLFSFKGVEAENWDNKRLQLPQIAASMLIEGFPVELMDGDADNVSVEWITAILDHVSKMLNDPRIFVIGVLGIQSSGKSTLLNAMFGLQFSVSAGRCTRGAFIQMLETKNELKGTLGCDYILVLDTEGLRAPEISCSSTQSHDNELATFVTGLGDITIVNIFGENPTEMHDILQITVQAFLRMKKIKLTPKCYFVHQNVAAVGADEKLMAAKRNTMEKLDEMTRIAAEQENSSEKYFRDVISFDINEHVWYLSSLWEGDPPMAPPNPGYSEKVQQLKASLLGSITHSEKSCLKLSEFKHKISDLWNALLHENFVFSFKNSLEISVYRDLERHVNSWRQQMHQFIINWQAKAGTCVTNTEVDNIQNMSSSLEIELRKEVTSLFENIMQQLNAFFKNHPHKELLLQWKSATVKQLQNLKDEWVAKAYRMFTERCNSQDIHLKITRHNAKYDIELVQKAQELAFTLESNLRVHEIKTIFEESWSDWLQSIAVINTDFGQVSIFADAQKVLLEFEKPLEKFILSKINYFDRCTDFVLDSKQHINLSRHIWQLFKKPSKEHLDEVNGIAIEAIERKQKYLKAAENNGTGYSCSYLEQILNDILNFITSQENRKQEYQLTPVFKADVAIVGMCRAAHDLEALQIRYVEANDPRRFLEKNKEKHFSTFQSYVRRASEGKITADRFMSTLKDSVCQAIKKNIARIIATDALCKIDAFKVNRYHLEKSMLIYLAKKKQFSAYIKYIEKPKDFMITFIEYCLKEYAVSETSFSRTSFKPNILDLLKAEVSSICKDCKQGHTIAENLIKENKQGIMMWGETFKSHVLGKISIMEGIEQINQVKLDSEGLKCFMEAVSQQMSQVQVSALNFINTLTKNSITDVIENATDICKMQLVDTICWKTCPFCFAVCTSTIAGHGGDHSVPFHRPTGVNGWHWQGSKLLCIDSCACDVSILDRKFLCKELDKYIKYCEYRSAGKPYSEWSIQPDNSLEPHWKWFVAKFKLDLENHHKKKFESIPRDWFRITDSEVLNDLQNTI